jgi:hypothetical protein
LAETGALVQSLDITTQLIGKEKTKRALLRKKNKDVNQGETVAVIVMLVLVYFILALTWKSWVPVLRGELASIHLKAKALLGNHPYNFEQRQPPSYNFEQRQPLDVEMLLQLDDRLLRRILNIPAEMTEKELEALRSEEQAEGHPLITL